MAEIMASGPAEISRLASQVLDTCRAAGLRLTTAESCTGGLVVAALTSVPGSSQVVDSAVITYDDAAKTRLLGVPEALLLAHGAVSEPVARAMAEGALQRAPVQLAVSVTGIAGPGGATPSKPVGLVQLACARTGRPTLAEHHVLAGDRMAVRQASVAAALRLLLAQAAG